MLFIWLPIAFIIVMKEDLVSHSQTFMKLFEWLYQSESKEDEILRLIAINYRLSHPKVMNDENLHLFLKNKVKMDLDSHRM